MIFKDSKRERERVNGEIFENREKMEREREEGGR
jgi:hypothetical protein